ncbi:MAG TPA: amidohydrolase family protein [Thermoanaerobaculia bacterium]|nr:amidohydrolase family protein [Thermoanaerobaculia bacterium]
MHRRPAALLVPLTLLALGLTAPALARQDAPATALHAGTLIDGASDAAQQRKTLVIRDGVIAEILDGFQTPAGAAVIDLREHTVLPGLMDMHVHLTSESSPGSYVERMSLNPADYAIRGTVYAERTLMAGFTTVRDLGGDPSVVIALRNAIDRGLVPGPKIAAGAFRDEGRTRASEFTYRSVEVIA